MHELTVINLGRMRYTEALAIQREHLEAVLARRAEGKPEAGRLLLVEHEPVITVSKRAESSGNLLADEAMLAAAGVEVQPTDRGGDITYHGPGQLVVYPILDLNVLGLKLVEYIRLLEDVIIETLGTFGIEGRTEAGATGVWVGAEETEGGEETERRRDGETKWGEQSPPRKRGGASRTPSPVADGGGAESARRRGSSGDEATDEEETERRRDGETKWGEEATERRSDEATEGKNRAPRASGAVLHTPSPVADGGGAESARRRGSSGDEATDEEETERLRDGETKWTNRAPRASGAVLHTPSPVADGKWGGGGAESARRRGSSGDGVMEGGTEKGSGPVSPQCLVPGAQCLVKSAKIAAIGVRVRRWVSMHGFALNVDPNLEHFDLIVPCGLEGRAVTSMRNALGEDCPALAVVSARVVEVMEGALQRRVSDGEA